MDELVGVVELEVFLGKSYVFSRKETLEFIMKSFTFAQSLGTRTLDAKTVDFLLKLKNRLYGIFGTSGEYGNVEYNFTSQEKTTMKNQATAFLNAIHNNLRVGLGDKRDPIIYLAKGGKRIRRRRGRRTAKKTSRKLTRKTTRRR